MKFKRLSTKVLLSLSRLICADLNHISVNSFDRVSFSIKAPALRKVIDATVDTSNWFAVDRSGIIKSTTYLLGGMDDEYFSSKISRNEKIRSGRAGILCMNAGSSNNYYHWVVQTILSIIGYQDNLDASLPFILGTQLSRYQQEWLDIINLDKRRVLTTCKNTTLELGELYILPTLYKPFDFNPCVALLEKAKDLLYDRGIFDREHERNFSKLYISRSDSKKPRGVHCEDKLEAFLREHGYATVKMADFSVVQQLRIVASADSIIAPHGAGLTNIIFAKPSCNIIEINNENYVNTCFSRIWEAMPHSTGSYTHLVCKGYQNASAVDSTSPYYHQSKCVVDFDELLELS